MWRSSTTTTTAISMSTWCRVGGLDRRHVATTGCIATIWRSTPTARARCASPTSPARSGIEARGYGMGVAAGDFDNDGWVDLYLTKFDAPNQLFRNNGDGTFTDVSKASGTDHRSWSVSASFVDFDRDGWLDLFVGNYLRYSARGQHDSARARPARPTTARRTAIAAAGPPVSQPTQRHVRRRDDARRAVGASSVRRSASRPPTSTATAGWTSTSPTTARRTSCG